ncbi:MAG TPA: MBL fold metallo-hydrolase [Caulobacterales bacterium]|jgi:glyoxylase-like metal-dependent hydrolase (beta-lactamase superfamily II)|nr:MBL fold metallo-hydrolase [Caulobacterales bacterium]
MPIPFVRDIQFDYGAVQQVSPLIRRVISKNPGPFTFHGTGVYIVGHGDIAVIDPGPDQPGQLAMLQAAIAGETVTHIFVTHRHLDHAPMARPLAALTGATVYASGIAAKTGAISGPAMEEGDDISFRPDIAIADGDTFSAAGCTLEAIFTPGHTSDHMCFALQEENALFSGDHIMGWSTTVVPPPDGDMDDYIRSLEKIRDRDFATLWPTHGPPITSPRPFITELIAHRLDREAQLIAQLRAGQTRIPAMVAIMYADVNPALHPAACYSVLAQMIRLIRNGRVSADGEPTIAARYTLTT